MNAKSIYVSMLEKGEIVKVESLVDDYWLVMQGDFLVEVSKQAKNGGPVESLGRLMAPPTIQEHRECHLYGNGGVCTLVISAVLISKVREVPT